MALRRNKDERIFFPFFSDILHISVAHCHIQIIAALARSVQKENQRIFLVFIKVFGQVLNISKIEIRIRLSLFLCTYLFAPVIYIQNILKLIASRIDNCLYYYSI